MKTTIYAVFIVSLFGFIFFSCEKESDNQNTVTGQLVSNSACKYNTESSFQDQGTPDTLSCVEYSFDENENKLTLKHINAGFNCCFDSLYCEISQEGDTIQIQEIEKNPQCYCECLYDLNIEINGIERKKYQLDFIEPYRLKLEKLAFEIDLTESETGSFCVTRKRCPWGIE